MIEQLLKDGYNLAISRYFFQDLVANYIKRDITGEIKSLTREHNGEQLLTNYPGVLNELTANIHLEVSYNRQEQQFSSCLFELEYQGNGFNPCIVARATGKEAKESLERLNDQLVVQKMSYLEETATKLLKKDYQLFVSKVFIDQQGEGEYKGGYIEKDNQQMISFLKEEDFTFLQVLPETSKALGDHGCLELAYDQQQKQFNAHIITISPSQRMNQEYMPVQIAQGTGESCLSSLRVLEAKIKDAEEEKIYAKK